MNKQSSEFSSLDAREKAATEGALVRCRAIADRIVEALATTKPAHLTVESLADFCASLERAAEILDTTEIGERCAESAGPGPEEFCGELRGPCGLGMEFPSTLSHLSPAGWGAPQC